MRQLQTNRVRRTPRRWLLPSAIALGTLALLLLILSNTPLYAQTPSCDGGDHCRLIHTTTTDFVVGRFYATGLRHFADGEVQLLPMGMTAPWQNTTPLPHPRAEPAAATYNNILYVIGGADAHEAKTEIYSATTTINGNLSTWDVADHLPAPRASAVAVISPTQTGAVLYVIGGGPGTGGTDTIFYKTFGPGGSLSDSQWQTATLPVELAYQTAVVNAGYLYVIGGTDSNKIYRFPILNSNGDLGTVAKIATLPNEYHGLTAVVWNGPTKDWLYVLGGRVGDTASNKVYYTHFNPDGSLGTWKSTSMVDAISAHGTIQANGNIYIIGGQKGIHANTAISQVHTSLIDITPIEGDLHDWGHAGKWIVTSPLPEARFYHGTVITLNGIAYVLGGYDDGGNPRGTVYYGSTVGAAALYAPSGSYISAPFDTGTDPQRRLTGLQWNATVTDTRIMALTMFYRTANTLSELQGKPWTFAGHSQTSPLTGMTNTVTLPNLNARYLQYRTLFTTTSPFNASPMLNAVRLDFRLPVNIDFTIQNIGTPPTNSTPVTQTIIVRVKNNGTQHFNNPNNNPLARPLGVPVVPTRAQPGAFVQPTAPSRTPAGIAQFVYVDVYIDPNPTPTQPYQHGNCRDLQGTLQFKVLYNLGAGQSVDIEFKCYVTTTGTHQYYAQIDTCPQAGDTTCTYGVVMEKREDNNIFGPVASGQPLPSSGNLFLPLILKGQ